MTTLTLEDLIEIGSMVADKAWARFGTIAPHWYVVTPDADGPRVIEPPPGPFTKGQKAVMVRRLLQDISATQVLFVDEAWQVQAETEEQLEAIKRWYDTHVDLEQYPGRIEAVVFQAEDIDGRMLSAWRQIERRRDKAVLGPLNQYEPTSSEGRLAGWLGGRGTKQ